LKKSSKAILVFSILTIALFLTTSITLINPSNQLMMTSNPGDTWTTPLNMSITGGDSYVTFNDAPITIDPQGRLHIITYQCSDNEAGNTEIYHIFNNSGTWSWSNVSRVNIAGLDQFQPTLAIDSNSVVHVVWRAKTPSTTTWDIFYANNRGGSWSTPFNITGTPNITENYPSVAIDSQGNTHIAWVDETNNKIGYVVRTSSGIWNTPVNITTDAYSFTAMGKGLSLRIDLNDNIFVVFAAENSTTHDDIFIMNNSAGVWSNPFNISKNQETRDNSPSMAIDTNNTIHLCWVNRNYTSGNRGVSYTEFSEDTWSPIVKISDRPYLMFYCSLTLDNNNKAHIAFEQFDSENYEIYYTNNTSGNFGEPVNVTKTSSDMATKPSIIIDHDGYAQIVYQRNQGGVFTVVLISSMEPVGPPTIYEPTLDFMIIVGAVIAVIVIGAVAVYVFKIRRTA